MEVLADLALGPIPAYMPKVRLWYIRYLPPRKQYQSYGTSAGHSSTTLRYLSVPSMVAYSRAHLA